MTQQITIEICDAVHSRIKRNQAKLIAPALAYEKSVWRDGPFGKQEKVYTDHFFTDKVGSDWYFLTGHLRRIIDYCRKNDIQFSMTGSAPSASVPIRPTRPVLYGVNLREDQQQAVAAAVANKRGMIQAPTRTGKTVVQYGIANAYKLRTVLICHMTDIVDQLFAEGERFGLNVAYFRGQHQDVDWSAEDLIVVTTRSTLSRRLKEAKYDFLKSYFKLILIDEGHHVASPNGEYAHILSAIKAPYRFAFSATMPDRVESKLSLEGFIGPKIFKLSIEEAIKRELLVYPKIVLKKAPHTAVPNKERFNYQAVYQKVIVESEKRNRFIAEQVEKFLSQKKSVLVLVNKIEHGERLHCILSNMGIRCIYVHGSTAQEVRSDTKQALIDKKLLCVIATVVWKEGVNIPTLDVCINAAGGKSEIGTLQGVGRVLTRTEGKTQAVIMDFFDPKHSHLIAHFGERISLYFEQGWL